MKVLAIDYGQKRVGLAMGDTETRLALPYGILESASLTELIARLKSLIAEEEISTVVVGEPVTLLGGESRQTKLTREFVQTLKRELSIEVVMLDERLTSRRADAVSLGAAAPVRRRDELAAMFLLQDYFTRQQLDN